MVGSKTLVAVVLLVVLGGVYALVLGDEPLNPAAAAWLSKDGQSEVPDAENGYVFAMGMIAAPGADVTAVGAARLAGWAAAARDTDPGMDPWEDLPESERIDSPSVDLIRDCIAKRNLGDLSDRSAQLSALLESHAVVYQRYRSLSAFARYQTRTPLSMNGIIVPGQHLIAGHRLLMAHVARDYLDGRMTAALSRLGTEIKQTRLHLALADDFFYKMIRSNFLRNDLLLLDMLIAHRLPPQDADPVVMAQLHPLTRAQQSLRMPIRGEFQGVTGLFDPNANNPNSVFGQSGVPSWAMWFIFKPNRTINRAYADLAWVADGSELSGSQWQAARAAHVPWEPGITDYAANYVGTVLAQVANPQFSNYINRFHDINGLMGLIQIKYRILRDAVAIDGVAAVLDATGMPRNPYTGSPMQWDASVGELYYEGPETDSGIERRVAIR